MNVCDFPIESNDIYVLQEEKSLIKSIITFENILDKNKSY